MDIATLAMALAVLKEGSVRGAGRLLGRPASSVADAFERFETALAMKLALRVEGSLSFTLAGDAMLRASTRLVDGIGAVASIADRQAGATAADTLRWAAVHPISMVALAQFNRVVRAGSIRRAARDLSVGQPNLSRQIAHLEKVMACPLLLRTAQGCEPTPQGMAFNAAALPLVADIATLTAPAAQRFAHGIRTIRLGTIIPIGHQSRFASRLARLVAGWQRRDGAQDLLVSSTTAEDLMEGLGSGRFDVALIDTAMRHRRFESLEIFASELVLAGPVEALAADPSPLLLLAAHPVAVPSMRSGLRQQIAEALAPLLQSSAAPVPHFVEVDALSIILNLIVDHGYLSVLPLDAVASLDEEIGVIRLQGQPKVRFHLVWQRTSAARTIAMRIAAALSETGG